MAAKKNPRPPDTQAEELVLCRIEEIEDGHSKEFHLPGNDDFTLCLVRQCADVYAYRNSCPHTGGPLNWAEDNFLTVDGEMIHAPRTAPCSVSRTVYAFGGLVCIRNSRRYPLPSATVKSY